MSGGGSLSCEVMNEPDSEPPNDPGSSAKGAEAVGDALRSAVERTLAATAGSATETRDRAQGLLDDVVRRGQSARERVTRRGEEATNRLADAIGELRAADGENLESLATRLNSLEARLQDVEASLHGRRSTEGRRGTDSNPQLEVDGSTADPDDQRDSGV